MSMTGIIALLIAQATAPLIAGQDLGRPLGEIDASLTTRGRVPVSRVGKDAIDPTLLARGRSGIARQDRSKMVRTLSPAACDRLWFGRQNDRRRIEEAGRDPCAG